MDVGRGRQARSRHAVPVHRNMVFGAPLGPVGRVGTGEITPALGAHRAAIQDQIRMAPQHADQHGVHLRQQAHPGPAREPPPQGRAAGLRRCRGQAAPRRALPQEAPQSGQHPDRFGGRMAASALPGWIADLNHRRNQTQDPDVQGCPPCLAHQTWASASGTAPSDHNQR
jgi:hypothetical protein